MLTDSQARAVNSGLPGVVGVEPDEVISEQCMRALGIKLIEAIMDRQRARFFGDAARL